jgi:hypothetical protein
MQHGIGQQRRDHSALRRPTHRVREFAFFHDARLQPGANQTQDPNVPDPTRPTTSIVQKGALIAISLQSRTHPRSSCPRVRRPVLRALQARSPCLTARLSLYCARMRELP